MVFQNLTMNLSALEGITAPNISLTDTSSLTGIIGLANTSTNDYLIFASMLIITFILYLTLSDKTPFQEFGYDDIRGLNISLASAVLIGLTLISVGWSNNFYAVGMFGTLWFLTFIGIQIYENKE